MIPEFEDPNPPDRARQSPALNHHHHETFFRHDCEMRDVSGPAAVEPSLTNTLNHAAQEHAIRFLDDPIEGNYGAGGLIYDDLRSQPQSDVVITPLFSTRLEPRSVQGGPQAIRSNVDLQNHVETSSKPRASAALKSRGTENNPPVSTCWRIAVATELTTSCRSTL